MEKLIRWVPTIGVMGLIYFFSSIPAEALPSFPGWFDIIVKKTGHLLAYASLAVCVNFASSRPHKKAYGAAWSVAVLYAITDEYHQLSVQGRGAWVGDILIDAVGAALGLCAVAILEARRTRDPGLPTD